MPTVNVHFRPYKGPGGKYRAVFRHKGQRQSHVVRTKKEGREWAEAEAKRIESALNRPLALMFSVASNEYLEDCATWMSPQTINEKLSHYASFATFIGGDFDMADTTIEVARKYYRRIQRRVSAKTANNHIKNLKALWNWHIGEGRLTLNPWPHVKTNPGEEHQEYIPPTEDVVAVLLAAKPWEQDYINIILKTGGRAGDPRRLLWEDVNFEHEYLAFWSKKRRGGEKKYRKISMPEGSQLYGILERLWKNRDKQSTYVFTNPATGTGYLRNAWPIRYMLKDAFTFQKLKDGTKAKFRSRIGLCSKAGVNPFTLKALRHFVTLRLDDSGKASLTDIQKLLGHEKATTTDNYLTGLRGDTTRAAAILDDDDLLKNTNSDKSGAQSGAQNARSIMPLPGAAIGLLLPPGECAMCRGIAYRVARQSDHRRPDAPACIRPLCTTELKRSIQG